MSDFAFMRFMNNNMLTTEESQHKGWDEKISKLSEEKLREILEEVRRLRNRKKSVNVDSNKEELLYVNR
jgi:hypothetical protein